MISRPLLSMVAESMVMRRPITHVGCFSACSGVMEANCSSGVWRNGPPEAVSQMIFTSWVPAHAHALVHGVVLAVDGQDGHIALAGRGGEDFARCHHAFLVGQAHGLAGQNRGMRRLQPCDPHDGRDDEIGFGQGGAGDGAFRAVDDFNPGDAGLA